MEQWDVALRRTGFEGIQIKGNDYDGPAQRSAMLVTSASTEDSTEFISGDTGVSARFIISPSWSTTVPQLVHDLGSNLRQTGIHVPPTDVQSKDTIIDANAVYVVFDNGSHPMLETESQNWFAHIARLLVMATRVLWITIQDDDVSITNAGRGLVTGVARVARGENQRLRFITLDIQETTSQTNSDLVEKIRILITTSFRDCESGRSKELEYIYKDGHLLIPRLLPDDKINQRTRKAMGEQQVELQPFRQQERPLKLEPHHSGLLENMRFVDNTLSPVDLPDSDIEIKVEACGVNFKDIMIALGQPKKPLPMAGEFSGTVVKIPTALQNEFHIGNRVCGFGATAYASHIRVKASTVGRLPQSMSFITAASVAVAFSTAHHALVDIARLRKGQSVLIHSAAGAVGQAALIIGKKVGAEIYATVGTETKRRILVEDFGLLDDHIFSSKSGAYKVAIHQITNGKGVDVVLNSLPDQLLQASWDCIASFGTFVELGKTDLHSKASLSMEPFDRNVTFASIDLSLMCQVHPHRAGSLLADVLSQFDAGVYTEPKAIVMSISEIETAFQLVQARKHVGKIVLEVDSSSIVKTLSQPKNDLHLYENATYLIAGGLGGLALEIAEFMATLGAKYIVLLSRRSLGTEGLQKLQDRFSMFGTKVAVFQCDITNQQIVEQTISTCNSTMPPIKGVIQATMVLKVRAFSNTNLVYIFFFFWDICFLSLYV